MVAFVVGAGAGAVGGALVRGDAICARGARPAGARGRRSLRALAESDAATPVETPAADGETAVAAKEEAPVIPETLAQAKGSLREKYGHLAGKDIKTVADALKQFNDSFGRPVFAVYGNLVNDIIASTHLACVCAAFRYDPVFAFGFEATFDQFLASYPSDTERARLRSCIYQALELEEETIKADAELVRSWLAEGKVPDDIFNASDDPSDRVASTFHYVANAPFFEWYFSRMFGIGLFKIMEQVGVTVEPESVKEWAAKLNISSAKLEDEYAIYTGAVEKMKNAEQLFAEVAARDKRKLAERMQEKAEQLSAEATKAEAEADKAEAGESTEK